MSSQRFLPVLRLYDSLQRSLYKTTNESKQRLKWRTNFEPPAPLSAATSLGPEVKKFKLPYFNFRTSYSRFRYPTEFLLHRVRGSFQKFRVLKYNVSGNERKKKLSRQQKEYEVLTKQWRTSRIRAKYRLYTQIYNLTRFIYCIMKCGRPT